MSNFVLAIPYLFLYLFFSRTESKYKDGITDKHSVRLPKLLRRILFPFSSGEVVSWLRVLSTGTCLLCAILMIIGSGISYTYADIRSQRLIFTNIFTIVGNIFLAGIFLSLSFIVARMDNLPKLVKKLLYLLICIVSFSSLGFAILRIIGMTT